jgi:hypothetical protein
MSPMGAIADEHALQMQDTFTLIIFNIPQPCLYLCEMKSLLLPHLVLSSTLVMSNML